MRAPPIRFLQVKTHRILLTLLALTGTNLAQGPLTPPLGADPRIGPANALTPGGAPQATMKTLHQVEPRTPISSLPFAINSSGSYYFTQNLHFTAATGHAITVSASNVTIDLMGFTLSSDRDVTGHGIAVTGNAKAVAVRNGCIVGMSWVYSYETSPGVYVWAVGDTGGFTSGIGVEGSAVPTGCRYSDLTVSHCRGSALVAMHGSIVERCHAQENLGGGFMIIAAVANDCTAVNNMTLGGFYTALTPGSRLTGCTAMWNAVFGFAAPLADLSHCTASLNEDGIGGSNASVSHCISVGNMVRGIFAPGGTVTHCTVSGNGGDGIAAEQGVITACSASDNQGIGIFADGGSVSQCVARANAQHGIVAKAVDRCVADYNQRDGIKAEKGTVTACQGSNNGWAGIAAFGGQVSDSAAIANGGDGIFARFASVTGCKASDNSKWGVYADHAVVVQCNATTNNTLNDPLYGGIYCDDSVVSHCFSKNNAVIQYQIGGGATVDANR